jgi:hypothetical protein
MEERLRKAIEITPSTALARVASTGSSGEVNALLSPFCHLGKILWES